ncbi:MAG: DUF4062 domain-containing protein [Planctomycetes bacterium]|nr:DUF4062 domain-containing protein [Planctomycetota bacterium]
MTMRVFLSSTREDLNADCRPSVVIGVQFGEAELVEMDSWDAAHEDPIVLCQCKIRDQSSHYVGLFGHRRGWAPDLLGRSITEAEYDWAVEHRGLPNMAVLLPLVGTELDLILRERARDQAPADDLAQKAFLTRVKQRTCQFFADLRDLQGRTQRRCTSWKYGGLRAMAAMPAAPPPPVTRPRPTDADLAGLGRRRHAKEFGETLELLAGLPAPHVAGFLIHGPRGHGHAALVSRLRGEVENTSHVPPRHVVLYLDVTHRGKNQTTLMTSLAKGLGLDAVETLEDLTRDLNAVLQTSDVIVEISQAQKFDGGLASLIAHFWRPLAAGINQPCAGRLIGLITHVDETTPAATGLLQATPSADGAFDPTAVICLPRLDAFTRGEIALWTPKWFRDHAATTDYIFAETRGHPADVYNLLKHDALWTD